MSGYTHFNISRRTTQTNILFTIACAMFVVATFHFVINFYRTVRGLADLGTAQGGMAGFLSNTRTWHALLRDALYFIQSLLGDSVAIYRCWILWERNFSVILFPLMLLASTAVSGCIICERLSQSLSGNLFDPSIWNWIAAYYSLVLGQNTITTGLMAFRLWFIDRESQACSVGRSQFISAMLLLGQSAALYFALQVLALVAFATMSNFQLILLGSTPSIIGTTFTLIMIQVALRSKQRANASVQTQTIGSIKMRDMGITIEIPETIHLSENFGKHDIDDSPA